MQLKPYMERLLAPISEENPAGESLRYESTYDRIQEARREDEDLPQGVWQRDLKKANWAQVRDLCLEALEKRSKDLQLAVWLMEALIYLEGFSGAREGLELLVSLCDVFWDDLYPEADEDLEARVAPVIWMNEKLALALKFVPITQHQSDDVANFTWADWESAHKLEELAQRDKTALQKAEAQGKITRAKFLGSVMFTPKSYYNELSNELHSCIEQSTALENLLDDKCGPKDSPSLNSIRSTLRGIKDLVDEFLLQKQDDLHEEEEEGAPAAEEPKADDRRFGVGSIRSRAEAYRLLSAAADYLFMTEPHSPTPYLVKRAVTWGNMTMTELLHELIRDQHSLLQIYSLLGIQAEEE